MARRPAAASPPWMTGSAAAAPVGTAVSVAGLVSVEVAVDSASVVVSTGAEVVG